jgi:hypothetical protein
VQERQDLIRQWEESVAQLRRTDAAVSAASELFAERNVELRAQQRRLDISAQFLDDQIANNKEQQSAIEALERELARLRTDFNAQQVGPLLARCVGCTCLRACSHTSALPAAHIRSQAPVLGSCRRSTRRSRSRWKS